MSSFGGQQMFCQLHKTTTAAMLERTIFLALYLDGRCSRTPHSSILLSDIAKNTSQAERRVLYLRHERPHDRKKIHEAPTIGFQASVEIRKRRMMELTERNRASVWRVTRSIHGV